MSASVKMIADRSLTRLGSSSKEGVHFTLFGIRSSPPSITESVHFWGLLLKSATTKAGRGVLPLRATEGFSAPLVWGLGFL